MAKSTKHKKSIKKEKTKIKLKLGKGKNLPKGVNVTNTQFQTRKIVLPDQKRSEDEGKGLGVKQFNIKKSLKSLEYNSVYVRQDGINELKKVAEENIEAFSGCLEVVFSALSKLFVDVDINLRKDAIKLVRAILSQKTSNEVAPFFDLLAAMLSCAMNNINQGVKQDSVLILDAYLETVPTLVRNHSRKILTDFMDQISRKSSQKNAGRVLVVNPISKLTTIKWRTAILKRVEKLISLISENQSVQHRQFQTIEFPSSLHKNLSCRPLLNCDTNLNLSLKIGDCVEREREKVELFGSPLFSVLVETWVEAAPEEKQEDTIDGRQLQSEALDVLRSVIAVLKALANYEDSHRLLSITSSSEYRKLLTRMMEGFPYTVVGVSKRGKAVAGSCLQENLELVFLCIRSKVPLSDSSGNFLSYIEDLLEHGELTVMDSQRLIGIVNRLLSDRTCSTSLLERFFPSLVIFLRRTENRTEVFNQALDALVEISLVNYRRIYTLSVYSGWLKKDILALPLDSYASVRALDVLTRNSFLELSVVKDIACRLADRLESISAIQSEHSPQWRLCIQIVGNAAMQCAQNGDVATAQKLCDSLGRCPIDKNFCTGLRLLGQSEIEARHDVEADYWPYIA